ncbi:DMT family transporter [Bacillus horti]|uniref:Drug/metabolite transporter (DMT)-like permease n=1 Tax=Caldalkalibacillus horti TaxID=77523 RepID=A0ABT9W4V7_9BACI|nr:DMT family transporter [Bacillus horti]MDQ0168094.1 drug/metabolite transporter (DMT)-like permease [Bacillus horti]
MLKNRSELYIFILLGSVTVIWGLNVIMIKYLSTIFPTIQLAAWRIVIAAIFLLFFTSRYWKPALRSMSKKSWIYISLIALTSIFAHQIWMAQGLQLTTGSVASLILALNPLTTILLAMVFMGEKFEWKKFIGVGLGFFGVIIVVGQPAAEGSSVFLGDSIIFLAMLSYVAGGLLIKKAAEDVDILTITTFSHVLGALMLLIAWAFAPLAGQPIVYEVSGFTYFVLFFSGSAATALCTTLWNIGIKEIGPSRTTMFLNLMPLSSLVFAAIFLNEQLKWIYAIALILIITGIYIGSVYKRLRKSPPIAVPSSMPTLPAKDDLPTNEIR